MNVTNKFFFITLLCFLVTSIATCQDSNFKNELVIKTGNPYCDSLLLVNMHRLDSLAKIENKYSSTQRLPDSLRAVIRELETNLVKCIQSRNQCDKERKILQERLIANYKVKGNEAGRLIYMKNEYDYYKVDLNSCQIKFYWKNEISNSNISSLKNLQNLVEKDSKTKLLFATNAGMYTPGRSPQGLFIQNRKTLVKIDRKKEESGNFYLQPNGIFFIDTTGKAGIVTTDQFNDSLSIKVLNATQSGPMLVINGSINNKFKIGSDNLNIRSGVGLMQDNSVVFAISNKPVNFYDFASFFKFYLKCDSALYLDGAISEMYLPELLRFDEGGSFGPIIGIIK